MLSLWLFQLKWLLLLVPTVIVCAALAQTPFPLLALLPVGAYGVLWWRDAARVSRAFRGRIIRRVGGYMERPRRPRDYVVSLIVTLVFGYLVVFHTGYLVLGVAGLLAVGLVVRLSTIRSESSRIDARFRRGRFVDEQHRGSVDPTT